MTGLSGTCLVLVFGPLTGAAVNPERAFGPFDGAALTTRTTTRRARRATWWGVRRDRRCVALREDERMSRPPVPPFTAETAAQKVQAAEDAWNTRDPEKVAAAYTPDTQWRNRSEFVSGRGEVVAFLRRKWATEQDYALRKSLWAFTEDRIAVRFQYEWRDEAGQWWRSYGNENWEFDADGYMRRREASINDVAIDEADRRIRGPRGDNERGDGLPLGW